MFDFARTAIPDLFAKTPLTNGDPRPAGNDDDWEENAEVSLATVYKNHALLPGPLTVVRENREPMVILHPSVKHHLWHAIGADPPLRMGTRSKGAPNLPMVRRSLNRMLRQANKFLRRYGYELLVGEAMRLPRIQRQLWCLDFEKLANGKPPQELTTAEWLEVGTAADMCSVPVGVDINSAAYQQAFEHFRQRESGLTDRQIGRMVRWMANLGLIDVPLDESTTTPHGTGGAVDVALIELKTGKVVPLGVPHGYTFGAGNEIAWMAALERLTALQDYEKVYDSDPVIRDYCSHFIGSRDELPTFVEQCRRNRRILFWAMVLSGFSWFWQECWHFNGASLQGPYKGAGSACHSLCALQDPHLDEDGRVIAVWGNPFAIQQAEKLILAHSINLDIGLSAMSATNQ